MKREVVKAPAPASPWRRWLTPLAIAAALGLAAAAWFLTIGHDAGRQPGAGIVQDEAGADLLPSTKPITRAELAALRWQDMDRLISKVGTDPVQVDQLIELAAMAEAAPATYVRALLLLLRERPTEALAAFATVGPDAIPPALLYAPHRLHQELSPATPDPYLAALRPAVAAGRVPALIQARVQALDGDLSAALASYLRSDPGAWAGYDLAAFRQLAAHQGLAPDLAELLRGALASGRFKESLIAPLREIADADAQAPELAAFKRQLRDEIEAQSPAGKLAIESARRLLEDRRRFVAREYAELIDAHRASEAPALPTETVLLLFLASVALDDTVEMDRWGQELKRRHADAEVSEWVASMKAGAR